jgi:hypothetical protein
MLFYSKNLLFLSTLTLALNCYAGRSLTLTPIRTASLNSGAGAAYHEVFIDIQNRSQVPQSVTIRTLAGSAVTCQVGTAGWPVTVHSSPALRQQLKVIPPNSNAIFLITLYCDRSRSLSGTVLGQQLMVIPSFANPGDSIRVDMNSILNVTIEIAEDRGAVTARVTASAHRVHGTTTEFLYPLFVGDVNGGRPF